MGFTNSQLHLLSQEDYNQQLFNSIGGSEGLETKVRDIGDGVATIGYGYTFNS